MASAGKSRIYAESSNNAQASTANAPQDGGNGKLAIKQALASYKLLEALRSYDTNATDSTALIEILQSYPSSTVHSDLQNHETLEDKLHDKPSPLHIACRCASANTVSLVLQYRLSDLNARDTTGQTPLHIATSLGRADIVRLLYMQADIDDAIKDNEGRTCLEVAKPEAARIVQVARAHFNQAYAGLLAGYVMTAPGSSLAPQAESTGDARNNLFKFVSKKRARCVDFNLLTSGSRGTTVLHEAARRRDAEMIKVCIQRGANPVARDRKGKMALEFCKDDKSKLLLRQAVTSEGRSLKTSGTSSSLSTGFAPASSYPTVRGYLSKWTSLTKGGYKTRWFVLDKGYLSYYRHQEEEGKASRGTLSMSVAEIRNSDPRGDSTTFEITTKLDRQTKWFIKAAHPVEALRWIEAMKQSSDMARNVERGNSIDIPSSPYAASPYSSSPMPSDPALNKSSSRSASSAASVRSKRNPFESPMSTTAVLPDDDAIDDEGESILGDDETTYDSEGRSPRMPYGDSYDLLAQSLKAQVEMGQSLVDSLSETCDAMRDNNQSAATNSSLQSQEEAAHALRRCLRILSTMIDEHLDQVTEREKWFTTRFNREIEAKRLWEDNLQAIAKSNAEMEEELAKVARESSRRKQVLKTVRGALADSTILDAAVAQTATPSTTASPKHVQAGTGAPSRMRSHSELAVNPLSPQELQLAVDEVVSSSDEEEDDDAFYDAIESGALTTDSTALSTATVSAADKKVPDFVKLETFEGYKHLRHSLPLSSDSRPPVSLWAILKGSIGKDLTKISFPVYFNEPTSMLQRMAEDMEYSECLDAAAGESDSLKRIAFVAAFAMSNYSSTIGRIAKPFNPMLSETFELASLDKRYRYISEQVSHHPPVSACIAEAPSWQYFGEVDAKSKFLGKSFEIRPTGNAHANLRIPKEWANPKLDYPVDRHDSDLIVEHYSWRKVVTSVSNFIMGNPQIDHYGDMVITNHRTSETCTLTFKARGWTAKNACEIKGHVADASGKTAWDIAGRWNGQLIARKAGAGSTDLKPDDQFSPLNSPTFASQNILLWRMNVKRPDSPFSLTDFAITLNDANAKLLPWLPPTDSRVRPDQHEFENGKFEKANDLKSALESLQRQTRAKREAGDLPPHKPRWFTKTVEPDTGERYWKPAENADGMLEYWEERTRVGLAKERGEQASWTDVDAIFGEYQMR